MIITWTSPWSSSRYHLIVHLWVASACPLMPFTFQSTCLGGSMKSCLSFVMQVEAPSSSIRTWASESKVPCVCEWRLSQVVGIPVKRPWCTSSLFLRLWRSSEYLSREFRWTFMLPIRIMIVTVHFEMRVCNGK